MKKVILGMSLLIALGSFAASAQKADSKTSSTINNSTSINKNGGDIVLQSGTQIAAQLQNSLDVQKAQVGDEFVLRTTKAIKQNGQTVIEKGSRLFGRVTEVQKKAKGNASSRISILFEKLEQGGAALPINAMITSITQIQSNASVNDTMDSDIAGSSTTRTTTQSSSGGGGLLGGVTNTVGGAVNSTAQTVGSATNTVGQTVNGTTRTVGGTLRGIQISQSADASAEGGSTLSLAGGNLRLEKGTTFNLRLNESASLGSSEEQTTTRNRKTLKSKQNPNQDQ